MTATVSPSSPALKDCKLLQGLTLEERELLLVDAEVVELEAQEKLFGFGEHLRRTYLIEQGAIALTLLMTIRNEEKEVVLETRREGSIVGWSALVKPYQSTLGAKAMEPARLVALSRESIQKVFAEHRRIEQVTMVNLSEIIGGRLRMFEALVLHDLRRWASENT